MLAREVGASALASRLFLPRRTGWSRLEIPEATNYEATERNTMFYELRTNAQALRDAIRIVFTTKARGEAIRMEWWIDAAEAYASMGAVNSTAEFKRNKWIDTAFNWRWN